MVENLGLSGQNKRQSEKGDLARFPTVIGDKRKKEGKGREIVETCKDCPYCMTEMTN